MIRDLVLFLIFICFIYCFLGNFEEHRVLEQRLEKQNQRIDYLQKQNLILEQQVDFFINEEWK